jgi:hypothetical protein
LHKLLFRLVKVIQYVSSLILKMGHGLDRLLCYLTSKNRPF